MSPLAPSTGQMKFEVLQHKASTVITIKSINQAWLKMFYYKVIAVNVVIHYKYIRHHAEKISEFFHQWKWAKEGSALLYWLLSCTWNLSGSLMILRGYFGNFWSGGDGLTSLFWIKKFKTFNHILHWKTGRTKKVCTLRQDNLDDPEKSHVILSLWFFAGLESSELFIPHFKEEVPFGNVVKSFLSRQSCKNILWLLFFSHFDRGENFVEK